MQWAMTGQRYSSHGKALGRVLDALGYNTSFLLEIQRIINKNCGGNLDNSYTFSFTIYIVVHTLLLLQFTFILSNL